MSQIYKKKNKQKKTKQRTKNKRKNIFFEASLKVTIDKGLLNLSPGHRYAPPCENQAQ